MWERLSVDLPHPPCWNALRDLDPVLYRRVADRGRALLAVGRRRDVDRPSFGRDGVADDWYVGYLSYDLKDRMEDPPTAPKDPAEWPLMRWWVPRWVLEWQDDRAWLHVPSGQAAEVLDQLADWKAPMAPPQQVPLEGGWDLLTDRAAYLQRAGRLKAHIQRGDIYEVNYCVTREARLMGLEPLHAFGALLRATDAAFAGLVREGLRYALCASPERFLAFDGRRAVGQPMKGTRPRSADALEDERLAHELAADAKERSENIMALDVMRNDLSQVAIPGSVRVEELCAVQQHRRVHQMVSTVSALLREDLDPWDAVMAAFPMASMTGAPKLRAMQLIDEAESRQRGLFSGSIGFFAPDGTGDLNVVIRTLLHDASTGHTSLSTGSAITAACDLEKEWEECALKARSVIDVPWTS